MKTLFTLSLLLFSINISAKTCTYSTYKWNTKERKAVERKQIVKAYSDLTREELEPRTGCSVCEEDQTTIKVKGAPAIKLCKAIAEPVQRVLLDAVENGFPILELVGYRVGMTKGELDKAGNRTQFSNHSFGTALDINASFNGLYDKCTEFGKKCRLIKGGEWSSQNPHSLKYNSHLVLALQKIGLKWGGNIKGKQKDFMHFSFTGY